MTFIWKRENKPKTRTKVTRRTECKPVHIFCHSSFVQCQLHTEYLIKHHNERERLVFICTGTNKVIHFFPSIIPSKVICLCYFLLARKRVEQNEFSQYLVTRVTWACWPTQCLSCTRDYRRNQKPIPPVSIHLRQSKCDQCQPISSI